MDIKFTKEQEEWQQEVVEFLKKEMTPEFLEELEKQDCATHPLSVPFSKKLAVKGWLTLAWPKKYGGQERSFIDQAIFNYHMGYYLAPTSAHVVGTNYLGRALLIYGTEEQKQKILPRIARQEIVFCQTHTEPEAGTDLASLRTRAVRDGDTYIINGEKCYSTRAHYADFMYMAVRTDPNAPKHRGISLFIVDIKTLGVTIVPVRTINHGRLSSLYFDNVRVPAENMVGQENRGWYMLMGSIGVERTIIRSPGTTKRLFEELVVYARETERDGQAIIKDPIIRYRFAEMATEIEVMTMLYWRVACLASKGELPGIEGNLQGLFQSQMEHRFANFAMQVLGHYGQLQRTSKWVPLLGRVERLYRTSCAQHAGGANTEILRNTIAFRGLGLPREKVVVSV